MKSYLKLFGPPILKAIKALEKIAIEFPEVCIWDTNIAYLPPSSGPESISGYFSGLGEIPEKRCSTIISKSGEGLGEYDFYFEWFKKPTIDELNKLIDKIDEALAPIGVRYSITTK